MRDYFYLLAVGYPALRLKFIVFTSLYKSFLVDHKCVEGEKQKFYTIFLDFITE